MVSYFPQEINPTFNIPNKKIFGTLPDYDHPTSISTFNSSNPYTATEDGFFKAVCGRSCELYVNGAEVYYGGVAGGGVSQAWAMTVFVSKGDIITTDVSSTVRAEFFPMKTNKNYCIKY